MSQKKEVHLYDYPYLLSLIAAGEMEERCPVSVKEQSVNRVTVLDLIDHAFFARPDAVEQSLHSKPGFMAGLEKRGGDMITHQIEKPCHIFISYSSKDIEYKNKLMDHLTPLKRSGKASLWDDSSIDIGSEWYEEIFNNLEKADIVLCLLSSNFVASEFCSLKELEYALAAHEKGEKIIIPIRIKEVDWDDLPIAGIQGLPRKNGCKMLKMTRAGQKLQGAFVQR